MKLAAGLLLLTSAAWGHAVSMSSSDLAIEGTRGTLELRMPLYEVAHVANPERALLEHFRIAGAAMVLSKCTPNPAIDQFLCQAEYRFPTTVETIDVECTFAEITVPNHVHLMRATLGGKRDQGVFDATFTKATLRFRPPTAAEIAVRQAGAGAMRALGGAVPVLLLVALALAARGRRELLLLAGMFGLGQVASVAILPHTAWQMAPRFVEAAAALTLVYLAVEMLVLPRAGGRWIIVGILGGFHGLYFHLFLQQSGESAAWVLTGAAIAEATVLGLFALVFWRLGKRALQVSAAALLAFGTVWFVMRLRG